MKAFQAALLSLLLLSMGGIAIAAPLTKSEINFFETKIRPVLVQHCYECHSPEADEVKADFLLDTRAGIRKGGASGRDAVIPGDSSGSQLIEAVHYGNEKLQMPPDGKLADSIIADLEAWIAMGAPDPREGVSKLPRDIAAENHWAFQPVSKPILPKVSDPAWPKDSLDHFVLARLDQEKLRPVADADRRTLLRRATLELTGLPPTRKDTEAFLADSASDDVAFAKVVDRLLASSAFGERWGRHWLDVARYAESSGYSRNMLYPYAWRYRDWVIDAFNRDMRYDRFVTEQLAGDLLPSKTVEEKDAQTIATGFLTIGPKTLNEGEPLLFELNVVDDQIDATCRGFLALTANCARCHDHKYDPIPTADYYAMAGIFRSSRNLAGTCTNVRAEHEKAFPLGPDGTEVEEQIVEANAAADEAQRVYMEVVKKRNELREPLEKAGVDWKKNPTPELQAAEKDVQRHQGLVKAAKSAIPDPPKYAMAVSDAPVIAEEKWQELVEAKKKDKKLPTPVRIADSPVYAKGLHDQPLDSVSRGPLNLFDNYLPAQAIAPGESGRLALAEWLVDARNPLTARVFVNRVWHHLFGTGLVETVDNFGMLGASPSHPDLLNDLALRFSGEEMQWSIKQLIRTIVLSRSWRLASTVEESAHSKDPDVRLIWRFRPQQLEGEVLRDSLIFVGEGLAGPPEDGSQVYTISMMQEKPLQREIGRRDYYYKDLVKDVRYRSVYLPMARDVLFDSLKIFDAPDPNLVAGNRAETIVPTQALFIMNSTLVATQAEALAKKIVSEAKQDEKRVGLLYEILLARQPSESESSAVLRYLSGEDSDEASWTEVVHAVMGSAEFRTVY